MKTTTHLINVTSAEELPNVEDIIRKPRHQQIKIIFDTPVSQLRESYGQDLKKKLINYQIAIHTIKSEINISKLISDEEIILHQSFFVQCAKDYREIGGELVKLICEKKKVKLNERFPHITFHRIMHKKQGGIVGDWKYFIHGYHCHFLNMKTKQEIEVPFMFGMEFGDLDPYFFSLYIKSTPKYKPLPVDIYVNFSDGERILKVMLDLGLLERINSTMKNHSGLVIKDRKKIEIEVFDPEKDFAELKSPSKWSKLLYFLNFNN